MGPTYTFAIMAVEGFVIGLIYDIYRVFRWTFKPSKWMIAVLDLLFWIAAALGCFYTLFETNYAEIRFYVFLGLGVGWIFYLLTASRYVIAVLNSLFSFLAGIFKNLGHLVGWPFRFVFNITRRWSNSNNHKNF